MTKKNYLLVIDTLDNFNPAPVIDKLDLCLDWTRLFFGTYLINTTSDKDKLYTRFKSALDDTKFFLCEIDLDKDYTGWLIKNKWDRIREFKNNQ